MSSTVATATATTTGGAKKKHICGTCDRAFTTSGHLARHSRVHTGERNHKCPFPGCETRCSRQDNLQQHYRIHLSPGSRRNSARSVISRVMNSPTGGGAKRGVSPPPALEPARLYAHHSQSPPDSPPPLTQATLPATAAALRSSEPASPDSPYSHLSMPPTPTSATNYSYRNGTSTYQEQPGSGYTYVHTTPSPPTQYYEVASSGASSRHSISHISPPSPESNSSGPTDTCVLSCGVRPGGVPVREPPHRCWLPYRAGGEIPLGVGREATISIQPQARMTSRCESRSRAWKGGLKGGWSNKHNIEAVE
ncbi:uncharacterized protein EV420DRAFT_1651074 [Desarmillaria tabescens]|uniref:C2H2-type domain-containing protein n=1 Tax=Armillaria tabescens TaxID=1929756 RepID=A0AA39MMJ7_ARMTA|nr:uncharacterized protein EV420DRAFT_1651074 [Desarmillaria tabescens]KAK0439234.1 hypothetical protein EV420DRAFT_1651074 [Desarmillaria tabescens]